MTQNQPNHYEPQTYRYTGLVCRRCIQPVAVVQEREEAPPAVTCPHCGFSQLAAPLVKI